MTTHEAIRQAAEGLNAAELAEIIDHCEATATEGAAIRGVLNLDERIAYDAFQTLANAARHVRALRHFGD